MVNEVLTAPGISFVDVPQKIFVVLTGICSFRVQAPSGRMAIAVLKYNIDQRRHQTTNPLIGMSLVRSYDKGSLDFLVLDEKKTQVLCGEVDGRFCAPPTRELAERFSKTLRSTLLDTIPNAPDIDQLLQELISRLSKN